MLRWWLWRWRLLWGWLLLGSAAVAASVVGVVIPAIVTPAVRVIATTSAAVETYIGETRQEAHHSQLGTLRSWVVLVTAVAPAGPGTEQELNHVNKALPVSFPDGCVHSPMPNTRSSLSADKFVLPTGLRAWHWGVLAFYHVRSISIAAAQIRRDVLEEGMPSTGDGPLRLGQTGVGVGVVPFLSPYAIVSWA